MLRPLLNVFSPSGRRGRLSILIFHRVLPRQDAIFPEEMHAERFDRLLAHIKRDFNVLALPEALQRLRAQSLPARALAITFDDGYADNHDVAMPLLKRHGLSATFFIATSFLDGGRMWNDTLIEAMRVCSRELIDCGAFGTYRLDGAQSRRQAIDALIGKIKYLEYPQRLEAVAQIAEASGAPLPDDLMMSAAQVRAMHDNGMCIGAHTRTHPILARLPASQAKAEIADSRSELEAMIGARVDLFAYPNGRPGQDYMREHVEQVRSLGFTGAVSTSWGVSTHASDIYQIPRFTPWDTQIFKFNMRMTKNLAAGKALLQV